MVDLAAYFKRVGYAGPPAPTLATLRALQAQHPCAIPFENLDALLGRTIRLDIRSLERKLVANRRGGYCFEHNTLFAAVLGALGFKVTALAARVVWERPADEVRARTHMVLLVETPEGPFLSDVGFGGLTPTGPLAFRPGVEQATPHETFRVVDAAPEFAVEARVRGVWKPLYRFDLQAQHPADIELLNYYVMGHAESPMLGRLLAARTEPERRFGLRNGSLAVHHLNGASENREIGSVAELAALLRTTFAIDVPPGPELEAALARVLA